MHEAHTQTPEITGFERQADILPVELHAATGIGCMKTGQHFDQCGFSRAIGAQKSMNLARHHID